MQPPSPGLNTPSTSQTPWSPNDEWNYVYNERLGILCEDNEPTAEQRAIAKQDADEAVRKMHTK